jgi:hypothetical protein
MTAEERRTRRLREWLDSEVFDRVAYAYRMAHTREARVRFDAMRDAILDELAAVLDTEGDRPEPEWKTAALLKDRTRLAIRERHRFGETVASLAEDFGVPLVFVEALVEWQMGRADTEGDRQDDVVEVWQGKPPDVCDHVFNLADWGQHREIIGRVCWKCGLKQKWPIADTEGDRPTPCVPGSHHPDCLCYRRPDPPVQP